MPHDDNEIAELLLELDNIERELSVSLLASPARRLRNIIEHLTEHIARLEADKETYRNELRSKRYKRDQRHNDTVTRGFDGTPGRKR